MRCLYRIASSEFRRRRLVYDARFSQRHVFLSFCRVPFCSGCKGIQTEKEDAHRRAGTKRGFLDERKSRAARAKRNLQTNGGEYPFVPLLLDFCARMLSGIGGVTCSSRRLVGEHKHETRHKTKTPINRKRLCAKFCQVAPECSGQAGRGASPCLLRVCCDRCIVTSWYGVLLSLPEALNSGYAAEAEHLSLTTTLLIDL